MDDWKRLNITEEQMAVLAHLSLKKETTDQTRARDIWPELSAEAGLQRLAESVAAINQAASAATGKPGQVIGSGGSALGLRRPELYVHVMTAVPYAEVR